MARGIARHSTLRRAASVLAAASVITIGTTAGATITRVQPMATPVFQKGINLYIGENCTALSTYVGWGTTLFHQIKALGANAVALDLPFYTDGHTASTFYAKTVCGQSFQTPPLGYVAALVDAAHAAKLQVLIRPYLDPASLIAENYTYWAGNIAPSSPQTWFNNYINALRPYLVMAQQHKVEHFAISTEYTSMETSSGWSGVITSAKASFKHDLVYTEVWRNNKNKRFWSGTSAGLDTYPYLTKLKVKSTVAQILAAWNARLKIDKVPTIARWTDDEIGILAQDGAYAYPNITRLSFNGHPFDQAIQSYWFTAACSFVKSHKMHGIYFATVPLYEGKLLSAPDATQPFTLQPLGLSVIKKCFK